MYCMISLFSSTSWDGMIKQKTTKPKKDIVLYIHEGAKLPSLQLLLLINSKCKQKLLIFATFIFLKHTHMPTDPSQRYALGL